MEDGNVQIVRECIEQVFNAKRLDRIYDYYTEDCLIHHAPYVGLGVFPDESSNDRMVVKSVAPGGPAAGKVLVDDVILSVAEPERTWEGFEQLRTGLWGQGRAGDEVTFTLLRGEQSHEVTVLRGRVEAFDITMAEMKDTIQHWLEQEMPDFWTEINVILGSGDLVAFFATDTGTSTIYRRSAVWSECNILRLQDGKIVEWWGSEDTFAQLRQLGFRVTEPERAMA